MFGRHFKEMRREGTKEECSFCLHFHAVNPIKEFLSLKRIN
jgi:hypothetical protein